MAADVFSSVLNDVAQKFMKNNEKLEQTNMKKGVKQEIMENNKLIGKELEMIKEQIAQIGGQVVAQQQAMMPMQMPMMPMAQYPVAMPMPPQPAPIQQPIDSPTKNNKKNNKPEKSPAEEQMNEIDEQLQKQRMNEREAELNKSPFEVPGKIIGALGKAASNALGTGKETPEDMGPAAGNPIELPSENNIMAEVGKGLSNAADTMKDAAGLGNKPEENNSSFFGNVASQMFDGAKQIGKNALNTVGTAAQATNKVVEMATYKKCNDTFLKDLDSIINSCDRDNYVFIYNKIVENLKLKKDSFRENVQQDIEALKPISLEIEEKLTEENNNISIDLDINNLQQAKEELKKKAKPQTKKKQNKKKMGQTMKKVKPKIVKPKITTKKQKMKPKQQTTQPQAQKKKSTKKSKPIGTNKLAQRILGKQELTRF